MINIGSLTRKNVVHSLWAVIGDIWEKVRLNDYSKTYVESVWQANYLLGEERLNVLLNTYDRLTQRYYQAYKGIIRLNDFSKNVIKRNRLDGYNIEYKYFFNEIDIDVRYIYPPRFLTNDFRSPDLIDSLFSGVIYKVYSKDKKVILLENSLETDIQDSLKNYIFLDFKKKPFIIEKIKNNEIFYKPIFKDTIPSEGDMTIIYKFELENQKDYLTEIEDDFIIFRFKDVDFLNYGFSIEKFFSKDNTHLYGFDLAYLDSYCEVNFGYPIGLTDSDIKDLKNSGFTWPEINQLILDLWKVDQRHYNFDQIYRIGALFSGNDIARILNDKLYLFLNDYVNGFVHLSTSKNIINVEVINGSSIPEYLRNNNKITDITKNIFLKVNSFILNNININDILIMDKETFFIRKIINNEYLQLDKEIINHPINNTVNILDKNKIKIYKLNDYGLKNLNKFSELKSGKLSNFSDILDTTSIVAWGDLPWGEFKFGEIYGKLIHEKCRFKKLEIGDEYIFGDCFQPYILPDYFSGIDNSVHNYYIQKQLALDNKEFTENNFKEYSINKTLLLTPFFSYSKKLSIEENNLFNVHIPWSQFYGTGTGISNYIYNNFYGFTNIKTSSNDNEYVSFYHDANPFIENKTNKSLLRLFIKLKKGRVKIGINTENLFENGNDKYVFQEKIYKNETTPKWEYVNIFIDTTLISNVNDYKIVIEAYGSSEFDIFGVQFFNSIPDYFEKLFNNRKVLEKFLSSNNYKLINLI